MADDIYGNMRRVTFELEEGDFTYADVLTQRGKEAGGSFASQLSKGKFLQIYTEADKTLQLASNGIKVGLLVGDPEGPLPTTNATAGTYARRYGPVLLFGDLARLKLDDANTAIKPGDYLAIDGTNKDSLDKEEDTTSNIIALEAAAASSGAEIQCLVLGPPADEAD
jgi:hypothetical protein